MHTRPHHNIIQKILDCFDEQFLKRNNILFGGGTRISLELDEYRESVDIDFLCSTTKSYRAVREQASNIGLGALIKKPVTFAKEIRLNRDAVRSVVNVDGYNIKLEFVNCDGYNLTSTTDMPFNVPMIDHASCFLTKLLAHSDRKYSPDRKDLFDLLQMTSRWGVPSENVWNKCKLIYGPAPKRDFIEMLGLITSCNESALKLVEAGDNLSINQELSKELIYNHAQEVLEQLTSTQNIITPSHKR